MLERWRLHAGVRQGLLVLALLVLLAQSLGLAHRFVHVTNFGVHHAQGWVDESRGDAAAPPAAPSNPWTWVFGEHKTSVDCQLYDQLCHDALGFLWGLVVAFALPLAWLRLGLSERLAWPSRFFSARAPPVVVN